jgi:hypothetical protein
MGYSGQDREFGERLVNAGVRGVQIRYSAVCVHLDHDRPYRTQAGSKHNQDIRRNTRRNRIAWTCSRPGEIRPAHAAKIGAGIGR